MKAFRKTLSIVLCLLMVLPFGILAASAAATADYVLVSPYANVDWETWNLYKGNLHTHSTYSDGTVTYPETIIEHYNQGFDFLAMADHGVTGRAWNERQPLIPLYLYQYIIGYKQEYLTDEQFEGITGGSYALYDGTARGEGMTCVTGANELNYINITKSHVNGYFLPDGVGNGFEGGENGHEVAVAYIEKNGGLSHINHPGDWIGYDSVDDATDPETVWYFSEILLKYNSCLGIEIFNLKSHTEHYTRVLWDQILMTTLPYGRMVWGFANNDSHNFSEIDTAFMVFAMEENNVENIKQAMLDGNFFSVARKIGANDVIGPDAQVDACDTDLAYPTFTSVTTENHTINVTVADCDYIQWIANGEVIARQDVTADTGVISLDLDTIEGAEDFMYVRAEIVGEGGMTCTQPIVLDNGAEKLVYETDTSIDNILASIAFKLKSTRIYVILAELIGMIVDEIKDLMK